MMKEVMPAHTPGPWKYAVLCETCGYLARYSSRREAILRSTEHQTAKRTPEPGVTHYIRIERRKETTP